MSLFKKRPLCRDIIDESFGKIRYNEEIKTYEAEAIVDGNAIPFQLWVDTSAELTKALARAKHVFAQFDRYSRCAKEHAVEKLLKLKNEHWLDEEEQPLTPEAFKNRMELEFLVFGCDGSVVFCHRDGDLFCGHYIESSMNNADEFYDANVVG